MDQTLYDSLFDHNIWTSDHCGRGRYIYMIQEAYKLGFKPSIKQLEWLSQFTTLVTAKFKDYYSDQDIIEYLESCVMNDYDINQYFGYLLSGRNFDNKIIDLITGLTEIKIIQAYENFKFLFICHTIHWH